ncbi:VOC family protein [Antarctobacter heliothermus]|uniref:Catechol 2,3-dioxygenase n=1 Tax=Antarctobacter heliothermus TaxID=74033 RepID=A0A239ANS2_9RHOB|nr:VOC family protein [Antarctobacter heliothermus]SNR97336.1 Catechol 2,3-dioxygenase [Antarctobacter heliothermus]
MARLEHVNITVPDAQATAAFLTRLLDWHVRWEGNSLNGGYSVHVGETDSYLALYSPKSSVASAVPRYANSAGLNHVGIVVDDLDAVEARVRDLGFETHNHADYEPGRRFYFDGPDAVEYEMVCYD